MASTSEEKFYVKVPTFDGKKSQWPFFRAKMRSYLAQKDMVELLASSDPVAKDNEVLDETKLTEKAKIVIREQNRKAAGLLLSCIDTTTEDGEAAFAIVEEFIDESAGYAGGNFPLAWEALKAEYEDKDTIDATDLKQSYYDAKMKLNERPSRFLNKMKKIRKRLANETKQKMR